MESYYSFEFKAIPDPEAELEESEQEAQQRDRALEHYYKTAGTVTTSPTIEPALAEDLEEQ